MVLVDFIYKKYECIVLLKPLFLKLVKHNNHVCVKKERCIVIANIFWVCTYFNNNKKRYWLKWEFQHLFFVYKQENVKHLVESWQQVFSIVLQVDFGTHDISTLHHLPAPCAFWFSVCDLKEGREAERFRVPIVLLSRGPKSNPSS